MKDVDEVCRIESPIIGDICLSTVFKGSLPPALRLLAMNVEGDTYALNARLSKANVEIVSYSVNLSRLF